jgi:DNA repair protein RadC
VVFSAIALSKTDLLAILLGSGIKGINVQTLAKTIITKFNKDFLNITIDDLLTVKGIGQAKALQRQIWYEMCNIIGRWGPFIF